jgi:hypothetical protein
LDVSVPIAATIEYVPTAVGLAGLVVSEGEPVTAIACVSPFTNPAIVAVYAGTGWPAMTEILLAVTCSVLFATVMEPVEVADRKLPLPA